VRTALQFASGTYEEARSRRKISVDETGLQSGGTAAVSLLVATDEDEVPTRFSFAQTPVFAQINETLATGALSSEYLRTGWNSHGVLATEAFSSHGSERIQYLRRSPQWLHLDADAMRQPSVLFFEREEQAVESNGARLPAVYDAILNRGDDTFLNIAREVRSLFPSIKNIRLKNIAADTKAFEIELVSGQLVPASFVSDGVLYYLAFAALEHLSPVSVVLVEEPENGLHPARIADVMRVLRRVSERVQVIMATHSPFVINELQGDEVTVVTRPDGRGTRVRRLCDTPNFEERSKVYALGELWVSYADGKNEEPLLAEVEGDP